jgi:hypothetical protein
MSDAPAKIRCKDGRVEDNVEAPNETKVRMVLWRFLCAVALDMCSFAKGLNFTSA